MALLANANTGGENVARGAALGALFGAYYAGTGFPDSFKELYSRDEIENEVSTLIRTLEQN